MIQADITRLSTHRTTFPVSGRTVIIHSTRSGTSMNPSEFEGTLNWMMRNDIPTQQQVSSHWVIARDGRTARVVMDNHQAWHAAEDNDNAWGIELEQGVESDGFTTQQLASLVDVARGYVEDFAVPIRHSEGGFIGHQETAQGRRVGKSDPGRLFPWDWFIQQLKEDDVLSTEERRELEALRINDALYEAREVVQRALLTGEALLRPTPDENKFEYVRLTGSAPHLVEVDA